MLTPQQAYDIAQAHSIFEIMEDPEEEHMLRTHNPSLHRAYVELIMLARGGT